MSGFVNIDITTERMGFWDAISDKIRENLDVARAHAMGPPVPNTMTAGGAMPTLPGNMPLPVPFSFEADPDATPEGQTVTGVTPVSAEVGAPDFVLSVAGSGFTRNTIILFNDAPQPTVFVSASEVTCGVSPATASGARTIPVTVREPSGASPPAVNFDFTEPAAPEAA